MKNNKKIMPIILIIIAILILLIIYILFLKKSVNNESPTTSTTTIITKKVNNVDPAASATTMLYTLQSFNNCNTGYILDFSSKDKLEYNDLNNDFIYNTICSKRCNDSFCHQSIGHFYSQHRRFCIHDAS